jgi:hypothetical protein
MLDGESVAVGKNSATDSRVRAATVLMFEMAESTKSCGCIAAAFGAPGLVSAAPATMQNKLKPTTPDASTVKGPLYSLIFKREFSYG